MAKYLKALPRENSKLFDRIPGLPLTDSLADAFPASSRGRAGGQRLRRESYRADIVSPKLCDDIIKYLAPTLEQHKGCTLIDVHPGAGLWSEKLHEFLKPKRHIFMEPEIKYKPFLERLVDKQDSAYRLTELSGANSTQYWNNYRTIFRDPDLWPGSIESLPLDDPKRREVNPEILLTGNLQRRYPTISTKDLERLPFLVLSHMAYGAFTNELIHRYGRVRQLWWVPSQIKAALFAHEAGDHALSTWSTGISLSTQITEVAGSNMLERPKETLPRFRRRNVLQTRMSYDLVQQRMEEQHMQMPNGRSMIPLNERRDLSRIKIDPESPLSTHLCKLGDLDREVEAAVARFDKMKTLPRSTSNAKDKNLWAELSETIVFPQLEGHLIPMRERNMAASAYLSLSVKADLMLRIIRLEANYDAYNAANPGHPNGDIRDVIVQLNKDYMQWIYEETPATQAMIEDKIVAAEIHSWLPSPMFSQDRRRYEAFRISDKEVYPRVPMMLLDCLPTNRNMDIPDLAEPHEVVTVMRMIVSVLYESTMSRVPAALDRLAPGAAQDLIPMAPDLTDPTKGGRWDPNSMRVKHLTIDMIEQLVKAWFEWPFRPPTEELMGMGNSEEADIDEEAADGEVEEDEEEVGTAM
ncbi:S-adenosyl-L-methionine-dependent methyltransferase [Polychaeton citri CBS 116435]|uniref:Mitochondrial transcription factor 1 n=1 Tax=Polychaeton citri CBS 116435 TaxID=1314669 RepID=A0A9P4ULI7_9PEZI|nr:S-adenosyl-L-methionine-dependent methyltransferase [Polychaeton citri CBS 116435]